MTAPPSAQEKRARSSARKWIAGAVVCGLMLSAGWYCWSRFNDPQTQVERAKEALAAGDYDRATAICQPLLRRQPQLASALLLSGEAAAKQGRLQEALAFYESVPNRGDEETAKACFDAGEILLQMHRASDAERKFNETLAIDRGHEQAHNRLAYLLGVEGRRWEAAPHLFELLRRGRFSAEVLFLIGDRAATVEQVEELAAFRKAAPRDPAPLIGLAKIAVRNNDTAEVKRLAKEVLAADPGQIEAQAALGQALANASDEQELIEWLARLPAAADGHPDIWRIRGQWAKRHEQPRTAARCFWEALRLDPNQVAAAFQLAQLLPEFEQDEVAERLGQRALQLQRLSNTLGSLYGNR